MVSTEKLESQAWDMFTRVSELGLDETGVSSMLEELALIL